MSAETAANSRDMDPLRNHLLGALSDREFNRLAPGLEPVHLSRPTELDAANEEIELLRGKYQELFSAAEPPSGESG